MNSPIKNYESEGAIGAYRFAKPGTADTKVAETSAATDLIIGITTELDVIDGEPVDVVHDGVHQLKLGGNVTRGQKLTSDADGKGIAAAPANDTNMSVGAVALASGVADDVIPVIITISQIQGEPA